MTDSAGVQGDIREAVGGPRRGISIPDSAQRSVILSMPKKPRHWGWMRSSWNQGWRKS